MLYRIIIISFLLMIYSCQDRTEDVLSGVFPRHNAYKFKLESFESNKWVHPHLILYRGEMSPEDYSSVIQDPMRIPDCILYVGYYRDMNVHFFHDDFPLREWWAPMINTSHDYIGHYDDELKKFTSCEESTEYRYAFRYLNGYCYLIIENTRLNES